MSALPSSAPPLLACPDCDLLQLAPAAWASGTMLCARCRAVLDAAEAKHSELPLALALSAAVALTLGLAFPLVTLNIQPEPVSTTLLDAVAALWTHDMRLLAVLVAVTTIAAPALEILAVIHVSLHLHAGLRPPFAGAAMRLLHAIDEWNMTEVFVLGALVALVKLGDYARVEYGMALASLGALMALLAGMSASFEAHAVWHRMEALA